MFQIENNIWTTDWKASVNQIVWTRHIWAERNGIVFVATATKAPVGFEALPTQRGATHEFKKWKEYEDDTDAAIQKVREWLHASK